jgi:hypothetical protein
MGVDFIDKVKDKWRKGWSRERRRYSIRDFYLAASQSPPKIEVRPFKSSAFRPDCPYELHVESGRVFVYDEGRCIGVCTTPPRPVLREIASLGGRTLGVCQELPKNENLIDVSVLLPSVLETAITSNEHVQQQPTALP